MTINMNAKFSDSSSEESSFSDAYESSGDTFMEICTISVALSEQESEKAREAEDKPETAQASSAPLTE